MKARVVGVAVSILLLGSDGYVRAADPGSGFPAPSVQATTPTTAALVSTPSGNTIVQQIEQYLSRNNLTQGYDAARRTYIGYQVVPCGVAPGKSGFVQSRLMAFARAELLAKQALASFLAQEVQAGRGLELMERPTLTPTETEDEAVRATPQSLIDRAILLANKKLDAALAETGYTPAEKKLLEQARDRYEQTVKIWAGSMIRGAQVLQTFEGEDASGQWSVGVVFVWSPKLQELADIVAVGGITPKQLPPGQPISAQIPQDASVLMASFGVRVLVNEHGQRVVVSYGQATPASRLPTAKAVAQQKAQADAVQQLRLFIGENVASELMKQDVETLQQLYDTTTGGTDVSVTQSQAFQQKVTSTANALQLEGIMTLKQWEAQHPSGDMIVGSVVVWSSDAAAAARGLRHIMNEPARSPHARPPSSSAAPRADEKEAKEVDLRGVYEGASGSLDAL